MIKSILSFTFESSRKHNNNYNSIIEHTKCLSSSCHMHFPITCWAEHAFRCCCMLMMIIMKGSTNERESTMSEWVIKSNHQHVYNAHNQRLPWKLICNPSVYINSLSLTLFPFLLYVPGDADVIVCIAHTTENSRSHNEWINLTNKERRLPDDVCTHFLWTCMWFQNGEKLFSLKVHYYNVFYYYNAHCSLKRAKNSVHCRHRIIIRALLSKREQKEKRVE